MRSEYRSSDPQDDDRLSAYLDGDLDPAEAAELEARLARDPALAATLDAVCDALVALRGLDEVDPPPGYAKRLYARLAEAHEAATDSPPRRRRWLVVGSAAAVAALLALLGGSVLRDAVPEAMKLPSGGALQLETAEGDRGGPVTRLEARSAGTVILDAETPLADEAAVRAHLADLPEARRLLGTPVDRVPELADAARRTITAAPPLRSGVAPGACIDAVEQAGLVAHVESVTYQRQPALAYVVASGSGGASRLDQVQIILVDPRTCVEWLFLTL